MECPLRAHRENLSAFWGPMGPARPAPENLSSNNVGLSFANPNPQVKLMESPIAREIFGRIGCTPLFKRCTCILVFDMARVNDRAGFAARIRVKALPYFRWGGIR